MPTPLLFSSYSGTILYGYRLAGTPCQTAAVSGTCQRGERHLQEVRKRGKMADAAASRAPAGPWITTATMVLGSFVAAMAVGIVNVAMSQMIGIS